MSRNNALKALAQAKTRLKAAGIESYSLDALILLCHATGKQKEWLLSHDYFLSDEQTEAFFAYISAREKQKPVQYIINKCEFMSLSFYVDENVLIPRADTELLAEQAINAAKMLKRPSILDMCTGSGCIAVSAAYYCADAIVTAADISAEAVQIAETNAAKNGVSARVKCYVSDLFDDLPEQKYDIIASNPPYIPENEITELPDSVRNYEPYCALNGGKCGLRFYERIAACAASRLNNGGRLMLEAGRGQMPEILEIMNRSGYNNINIYKDLAGIERVIEGKINV